MNFTEIKTEQSILLDAIPAGIICLDFKERLVLRNDKADKILGINSGNTSTGNVFFDEWNLLRPDLSPVPENERPHKIALRTGESIEDAIVGLQHKNEKRIVWVNFSVTPKPDKQDEDKSRLVIVIKNISNRVNEIRSLQEKENIHKALVDNMHSGLMIIQDKRIVYVNKVLLEIAGYEEKEIIGKRFLEFVHPSERNRIRGMYLKRLAGMSIPDRYRSKALKQGGGCINVDVAVSNINYRNKPSQMVVMNDIDEEIKARAELEQSEIKYQTIVASIDQGIVTVNLKGRIVYVNNIFSEITGISPNEIIGKNVLHVFKKLADGSLLVQLTKMYRHLFAGKNLSPDVVKWRDKYFEISGKYEAEIKQIFVFIHDVTDLKQSSIQLINLSGRLNDVVKSADLGTWEMDIKESKFVLNEKSANIIGYTLEELGDNAVQIWHDHIFPEDRELVNDAMNLHLHDKADKYSADYRMKTKTGCMVWIHSTGKIASFDKDGKPLGAAGIHLDITKRKQAEKTIKESERQLSTLMNNLPGLVYRCLNDANWTMLFLSQGCKELTGYDTVDLLKNKHISYNQVIHPEDRSYVKSEVEKAFADKLPFELEYRIVTRAGAIKHVWERGAGVYRNDKLIYIEGFVTDVTERYINKIELEQSEQRFKQITDQSQTVIWEVDENGLYTFVSPLAESSWGYRPYELIGKKYFYDIHPEKGRNDFKKEALAVFSERKKINNLHNQIVKKDGELIWVTTNGAPVFDTEGKFIGYRGSDKDITDLVNFEKELKVREQKYRSIFDNIQDAYYESSAEGKILEISPSIEHLSRGQYRREELIGRSIIEMYAEPKQRDILYQKFAENERISDHELILKNKDGSYIPVAITARMMVDENRKPLKVIGVIRDISERKKAEKDLIKSESRLKFAQQIAKMGSWEYNVIKSENKWSENFFNLVGYKMEEFDPTFDNFMSLVHEEDRHLFNDNRIKIEEEKTQITFDFRFKTADGSYKWFQNDIVPVFKNDKLVKLLGTNIDITEKKEAEKQLADSERFYKTLFENSGTYLTVVDKSGKIILANTKASVLATGDKNANIEGLSIRDYLGKKEAEVIIKRTKEFIETGDSRTYEQAFNLHSCTRTFIVTETVLRDETGAGYALLSSLLDITDKKEYQEEIRLLSAAVEQSPVGILINNTKAEIEYVNAQFTKTMGYSLDEIKGKTPEFLLADEGEKRDALITDLKQYLMAGKSWTGEVLDIAKDGKKVWINNIVSPVYDDKGEMTHFVFTREDITEKKKMWEDLVVAKEKAEESNKLKSTFLATMSHELRTPLNHVIGFSEIIQDISDDEEIVEFARTINSSGTGLLEIIEDIFNLALYEQSELHLRVESYKIMNIYIELKDQLKEILNASEKESNIELRFNPESGLLGSYVECDKNKVKQVIVNLFKNAVKFTEEGSIEFGFYQTDTKNLAFYVKDTGVGIPADKINMIFDFFRQADETHSRQFGGVGIGLAISRKIADAMKGSIGVESVYGEGAMFTFSFPVEVEEAETDNEKKRKKPELDLHGFNILLVEDDPGSMQLASRLISETTATIFTAENGRMALEITDSVDDLDLVLMDLKMPVMDGFEATEKICARHPDLMVVALTSYNFDTDRQKAIDAGCRDIITKPVNKKILHQKLREYLLKI
ncbi:PAS domain S-box protein [Saccharicrinis sp. FJH2]|uniref:PAS domain S-box protein n=1 Tax=Saccharicrinis sp. FJH65 TaxID=3344659 RepID=UPI0035F3296C